MVNTACLVTPIRVAEIVAVPELDREAVVTMKCADVAPPGIRMDAGTVAPAVLESAIKAPAAGAGWSKVTVAVELLPPVTVDGLNDNPFKTVL